MGHRKYSVLVRVKQDGRTLGQKRRRGMKKRFLALLITACVTVSSVISGGTPEIVLASEQGTEVVSSELTGGTDNSEAAEPATGTGGIEPVESTESADVPESAPTTEAVEPEGTEAVVPTDGTESTESSDDTEMTEPENGTKAEEPTENSGEDIQPSSEIESTESSDGADAAGRTDMTGLANAPETAADTGELTLPTGLLTPQAFELTALDERQIFSEEDAISAAESQYASAAYFNEWDKYSGNYVYNLLSSEEKAIWDRMDLMCRTYLSGTQNAQRYTVSSGWVNGTGAVLCDGMGANAALNLAELFCDSNPQYYFIKKSVKYYTSSTKGTNIIFCIYPAFASGTARAAATAQVLNKAQEWVALAGQYATEEQKVQAVHDAIVQKVYYNDNIYNANFNEDTEYSQSAYSVFCTDKTVCAGYSQALSMVLNGAGIDSFSVTSYNHQWNKIRVNDSWYNADATWADQSDGILYRYFLRSDAFYDSDSSGNAESHTEESYWNGYLPVCTLDSGASDWAVGTMPVIAETTAAPSIFVGDGAAGVEITITSETPGAEIYYTLDGMDPSPSFTRSSRYTGPFSVDSTVLVRAVAVSNGRWDSAITGREAVCITYSVVFDGNGSTDGSMEPQTIVYGNHAVLAANAFVREGYTFTGWNTKADGSGTFIADGADGSTLTTTPGAEVTLYAQWQITKYNIIYELGGGKNNSANPATYTIKSKAITLKNPTRKGYVFAGWYKNASFKSKFTKISSGSTGDVTVYAKWTAKTYTVKFSGNGSTSGSMPTLKKCKYGKSYTLKTNAFKKKGYKFAGWNTKANGSGTSYANKAKVKSLTSKQGGTVTLYAQWTKAKYKITYDLKGGKNSSSNPASYKITTSTIKLKNPTRKGYTFAGWYTDAKYKNKITQIKKGSTGNKKLYAKWKANTYTIKYVGNKSTSGKMGTVTTCKYGKKYTLKSNKFKRAGYKFTGWNTKADGSGTDYKNKQSIKNLTSKKNKTVTLYAQWKKK